MRFAENNRISHRQLFRQIILVFPAPFLLCLFKNGEMLGVNAMAGTILAAVLLSFYVIWLIRLAPAYGELSRMTGNITVRFIGLFFLLYVILSAAFLADLLAKVIPQSLISGISGKWLSLLAVAACSLGTHRGMQRRGRIAEISGGIFLAGILLLMILSAGQGKAEYFLETVEGTGSRFSGKWMIRDVYAFLCVFSGVGLLPFGLEKVEKRKCQKAGDPGLSYRVWNCPWYAGSASCCIWKKQASGGNISGAASSGRGRSSGKCAGKI